MKTLLHLNYTCCRKDLMTTTRQVETFVNVIDAHTHVADFSPMQKTYENCLSDLRCEAAVNGVNHLIIIAGFKQKDGMNASTARLLGLVDGLHDISVVGSVDVLCYTEEHVAELSAWMKHGDIVGLKFYTGYQHFFPQDPRCVPLYELCLEYGLPAIFHSGDTLAGYVSDPKIKYSHPLHLDDVAIDFPDLNIIIAHAGNPWTIDAAEVLYKNSNVYADISGLFVGDDVEGEQGRLVVRRLKDLLTYVGSNKLLYGSDWPITSMESYLALVHALDLSDYDLELLLSGNAANLFHLAANTSVKT